MRRARTILAVLLVGLAAGGCYRTHYVDLYEAEFEPREPATRRAESESWRSFWIYGWAPEEMEIDAAGICGEGHVREIETQRSFLQGLVTGLTTIYINIYSPYTGKVHCFGRR